MNNVESVMNTLIDAQARVAKQMRNPGKKEPSDDASRTEVARIPPSSPSPSSPAVRFPRLSSPDPRSQSDGEIPRLARHRHARANAQAAAFLPRSCKPRAVSKRGQKMLGGPGMFDDSPLTSLSTTTAKMVGGVSTIRPNTIQTSWSRKGRYLWSGAHSPMQQATIERVKYVILGGGTAAGYAASEFAKQGLRDEVCIVSKDEIVPYERSLLLKEHIIKGEPLSSLYCCRRSTRHDPAWYQEKGIKLYLGTEVTRIDFEANLLFSRTVNIRYDHLLIAVGSRPVCLKEAQGIGNIFHLRNFEEAHELSLALKSARTVLVVGGGFIGLEASYWLVSKGVKVILVCRSTIMMNSTFSPNVGLHYDRFLRRMGTTLLQGITVARFEADERNMVKGVHLSDGRYYDIDAAIVGIGATANIWNIKGVRGVLETSSGGIRVDHYMRTNVRNVFAAGDVAACELGGHSRRTHPHAEHAAASGSLAARVMLGEDVLYAYIPRVSCNIPAFSWVAFGFQIGTCYTSGIFGENFTAYWVYGSKVVGLFKEKVTPHEEPVMQALVKNPVRIDPRHLRKFGVMDVWKFVFPDVPPPTQCITYV